MCSWYMYNLTCNIFLASLPDLEIKLHVAHSNPQLQFVLLNLKDKNSGFKATHTLAQGRACIGSGGDWHSLLYVGCSGPWNSNHE